MTTISDLVFESNSEEEKIASKLIFPGFENISSNGYVDVLINRYSKFYAQEKGIKLEEL